MPVGKGVVWILICSTFVASVSADIRCYSCTSYMSQCRETVDDGDGDVYKANCNSKCFVRMGEDGAYYRGCFDGFMEVTQLKYGFTGCRNQTWNRKSLQWCMCDTDLCNKDLMGMKTQSSEINSNVNNNNYVDDNFLKYDYNDMKYDDNKEQKNVVIRPYEYNGVSTYDAKESDGSSFMEAYAREGPMDANYDEALFAVNDPSYNNAASNNNDRYQEIKYMSPENPTYPRPYDKPQRYYSRISSPGGADAYDKAAYEYANKRYNQYIVDYPQQQAQYSSENGPVYNNLNTQKPYDDGFYQEPLMAEEKTSNHVSSRLANKIRCNKSGYYQNPHDCRQFVACLMDPYSKTPVMHVMKCPEGLVWDNKKKICMEYSTTCNVMVTTYLDGEENKSDQKLDVTGYRSNQVIDQIHGNHAGIVVEGDSKGAENGNYGNVNINQDGYQDNSYGVSGDVNRELYSDNTYNTHDVSNESDGINDVVF